MTGLLHGLGSDSVGYPARGLITALRPQIWRATPTSVPVGFATSVGARYEFVLSDVWGYPADHWPHGRPYQHVDAYEEAVRSAVARYSDGVAIWDVWNEPDTRGAFWEGTEQQFFETYLAAYRAIRAVAGPTALVAGPSLAFYDLGFLKRFADYCVLKGCEVNVITWHEMGTMRPLSTIADRLRTVRREIVDNPAYAALRIREIHINESVGPYETYNPAASLTYVQYLELGGADAASRACWLDRRRVSSCGSNSLDGLLTPGDAKPRSVWWAYKFYADGAGSRVRSVVSDPRLVSLASRRSASDSVAQVLVGYSTVQDTSLPPDLAVTIRFVHLDNLPALAGQSVVLADVSEVPNLEEAPLFGPRFVRTDTLKVVDASATFVMERVEANAVYVVSLRHGS